MFLRVFIAAFIIASATAPLHAQASKTVKLAPAKLKAIDAYFENEVRGATIPGAVLLVQHKGKPLYSKTFGLADIRSNEPMTQGSLFRVYSMSKPVTSVAALMLVDDGKLKLDDPLSKYIPEFADTKVGIESKGPNGEPVLTLVAQQRPITIEDLLRQSSGMPYGFYGKGLVRNAYGNAGLFDDGMDNASVAARIARLPLAEQPGTAWDYGHATDVLGRVIEIVSGQSLYEFQKSRLFDPLGMTATSYYVADPSRHHLIVEPLPSDLDPRTGSSRNPRVFTKWESGGGGLISSTPDFARFAQMILNGGKLDGRTYLRPETFAKMVANQVDDATGIRRGDFYFPGDGYGFGLGFGIRISPGDAKPAKAFSSEVATGSRQENASKITPGSIGELKWDGATGTTFWIDRERDLFILLMIATPSDRSRIQDDVKKLVYDALK